MTELNVVEDPQQRQLTFSLIESAFMKQFVGSWNVTATPGGLTEVGAPAWADRLRAGSGAVLCFLQLACHTGVPAAAGWLGWGGWTWLA